MITVPEMAAEELGSFLSSHLNRRFGSTQAGLTELIPTIARLALECIGNSDALYHTVEHTMLVTLVGYEIMKGRSLLAPTSPDEYAHVLVACLLHDIGYVRGICAGDTCESVVINEAGDTMKLSAEASDAALAPYHVDRSKLFIRERAALVDFVDGERIARAVELTRFPVPNDADHAETDTEAGLVRAADLIGQLADPYYPRKCVALFYEFEEIGLNEQLGYASPGDLIRNYPKFFWTSTYKYIKPALKYLECTASGRQWTANLFRHVFASEHLRDLAG